MNKNRTNEEKGNWFFENADTLMKRRPDKKRLLEDIFFDLYGEER